MHVPDCRPQLSVRARPVACELVSMLQGSLGHLEAHLIGQLHYGVCERAGCEWSFERQAKGERFRTERGPLYNELVVCAD